MEQGHAETEIVQSEGGLRLEVVKRGMPAQALTPQVTVQGQRVLSANEPAAEALGYPEPVEVLYAEPERVIGLRAASLDSPNAYKLRITGRGHTFAVACKSFLRRIGMPPTGARRYEAQKSGPLLLIDLKQEGEDVSRMKKSHEGD